ncbi:MAG: SCO family protein, partial [Planctomycetes bacterium]|nr:SCO family protein [Planctomycetota bacterium]
MKPDTWGEKAMENERQFATDEIANQPKATCCGMRPGLFALGLVLWGLAAAGLYVAWKNTQRAAEERSASGAPVANGAAKPIVLSPQQNTLPPQTAWDPAGVDDFSFTERSGRTVTKADLLGRPWAVCFVFTRCAGPCLSITGQMRKLQEQTAGSDVRLVTITVDPDYDTPEQLQKYAHAFAAEEDRWLFLTGDKDEIYRLIQDSFRLPVKELTGAERKPGWEVLHSTSILHVNAQGVVVGKYEGRDDAEVAKLRRALLDEASMLKPAAAGNSSP